jgi:hypothetical protein
VGNRPLRSVGPTSINISGTGTTYQWRGQRVIEAFNETLTRGFQNLAAFAESYWRNEEWTRDRHPYMTGNERDQGFFSVSIENGRVLLEVGAETYYATYEEFGTIHRPGHYPIRNTLDRVAYRFGDVIRDAARQDGLV